MKILKLELSQAQIALLAHCVREWEAQQKPVSADLQKSIAEHCDAFGELSSPATTSQTAVDIELDFLRNELEQAANPDCEYAHLETVSLTA